MMMTRVIVLELSSLAIVWRQKEEEEMLRPLEMAHQFLAEIITSDDVVVDATMGNGHDTLFLAQKAKKVFAFDIQKQALQQTQQRLKKNGYSNVELILAGHETVADYVTEVKAAIFNLGYLPNADKSIITQPQTTLLALQALCHCLVSGGRVAMMIYDGHKGGEQERDAVLSFVTALSQQEYTVVSYRPLNQLHHPPFLIMIEKH